MLGAVGFVAEMIGEDLRVGGKEMGDERESGNDLQKWETSFHGFGALVKRQRIISGRRAAVTWLTQAGDMVKRDSDALFSEMVEEKETSYCEAANRGESSDLRGDRIEVQVIGKQCRERA